MTRSEGAPNQSWFSNFGQISFGTSDLGRTIDFWENQLAVGPWTVFRGLVMDAVHEGASIHLPFDVALAWHDGRVVELIQPLGDGPSPLHDALNRPMIGIQRLASVSEDIERDAALAECRGMQRLTEGQAGGQRFIHYRCNEAPGVILELLERTPAFDRLCDQLRRRAALYRARAATTQAPPIPISDSRETTTMRAAMLDDYGDANSFRIADVPQPAPGPREVRIKVTAAAVNPVDVKVRKGQYRDWLNIDFPVRLGGDVAGIVDAVGCEVRRFAAGDRVAGMINPFANGAYAEYVCADESALVSVPAGIDLIDAAALPTGVLTGTQLVETGLAPRVGDRVLVLGAGGSTGRAAVLALIEAGAVPIAGIRASSRANVADLPVDVVDVDDREAVAAAGPYDAIADTVGGDLLGSLFPLVRPDGIVASVAMPTPVPPDNAEQRFCPLIVRFDGERLGRFMAGVAAGRWSMPVAHRLPLEEVGTAHRLLEAGGVGGKIVLTLV